MRVTRELRTAWSILRNRGPGTLAFRMLKPLVRTRKPAGPNECTLVFETLRGRPDRGVMIDVGAHVGTSLMPFARRGWTVYAFEPDAGNRARLQKKVARFDRVTVDPRAVSDTIAGGVPFYTSDQSTGISGLSAFHQSHSETTTVDTITLAAFMAEHGIRAVDFLKVDAEGFDLLVLKGLPWDKIKPHVIMCEFEDAKTRPLDYTYPDMARFLEERGYRVVVSEWFPIQAYGREHQWRCFSTWPCELEDQNGWGNLIAATDDALFADILAACRALEASQRR